MRLLAGLMAFQGEPYFCLLILALWLFALPGYTPAVSAGVTTQPPRSDLTVVMPRAVEDYLPNPGIGWQEARTITQPLLPETVRYRRPQYAWKLQNPQEGRFDWTAVDADIQAAKAQGKQLSFRLYSMRGETWGGHQVPQWVLVKGAVILPSGEPDYRNCIYQDAWSHFVEAMRQRYDGHQDIAFIDISGYGNFNEWNYEEQTDLGEESLDAQARRRLADMFIGGSGTSQCWDSQQALHTISYAYPGFQHTQLLMPFAGIQQSTRYVASRRRDVGIRHDCLGSKQHTDVMMRHIGDVLATTWKNAPIVYEFCPDRLSNRDFLQNATAILKQTHGSMVHDNLIGARSVPILTRLLRFAGYRFVLKQVTYPTVIKAGESFTLSMLWINTGYAPVYPKMGQLFALHVYLVGANEEVLQDWLIDARIATWMPAERLPGTPPEHRIHQVLHVPTGLAADIYTVRVGILDSRRDQFIHVAIHGRDTQGRYLLGTITLTQ